MTPEGAVQKAVIEYLNYSGFWVWRRNIGGRAWQDKSGKKRVMKFGVKGMADLEGIAPDGRHVEVEVKAPGETPSYEQNAWLEQARAKGAIALWCDSLEMLQEKLRNL